MNNTVAKTAETGHDLLAEFHETLDSIEQRTDGRKEVVDARLAQLESEQHVLNSLKVGVATVRSA